MKKYFFIPIILITALTLPQLALAVTATPSAKTTLSPTPTKIVSPTPTSADLDEQTQQNLQDRIKNLVQENLATTEANLKEKVNQQSFVGFVGNITEMSSGVITLRTHDNILRTAADDKTVIVNNGQNVKVSTLAIGDKIIIMGTVVKKDIIQAKRIVVIKDEPVTVTTQVIIGDVSIVDTKKKTVTLSIDGTPTVFTLSKKSPHKLTDFIVGQKVIAIIKLMDKVQAIYKAKVI